MVESPRDDGKTPTPGGSPTPSQASNTNPNDAAGPTPPPPRPSSTDVNTVDAAELSAEPPVQQDRLSAPPDSATENPRRHAASQHPPSRSDINVQELVAKLKAGERDSDGNDGADAVMLVGPTGVGKSTTINHVLDRQITWANVGDLDASRTSSYRANDEPIEDVLKRYGLESYLGKFKELGYDTAEDLESLDDEQLTEIEAKKPRRKKLEKMAKDFCPAEIDSVEQQLHCPDAALGSEIGHSIAASQTRAVTGHRDTSSSLLFCDTPGTGDVAGAQQDVENALLVSQAMRRCKSARIAVVCRADTVTNPNRLKLQTFVEQLTILARSIKNPAVNKVSVCILFTHCKTNDNSRVMRKSLEKVHKSLLDDRDAPDGYKLGEAEFIFLKHFIETLTAHETDQVDTLLVRPVDDPSSGKLTAKERSEAIRSFLAGMPTIQDAAKTLGTPLESAASASLAASCAELGREIHTELQRAGPGAASQNLADLFVLEKALCTANVTEAYDAAVTAMATFVNNAFDSVEAALNVSPPEFGSAGDHLARAGTHQTLTELGSDYPETLLQDLPKRWQAASGIVKRMVKTATEAIAAIAAAPLADQCRGSEYYHAALSPLQALQGVTHRAFQAFMTADQQTTPPLTTARDALKCALDRDVEKVRDLCHQWLMGSSEMVGAFEALAGAKVLEDNHFIDENDRYNTARTHAAEVYSQACKKLDGLLERSTLLQLPAAMEADKAFAVLDRSQSMSRHLQPNAEELYQERLQLLRQLGDNVFESFTASLAKVETHSLSPRGEGDRKVWISLAQSIKEADALVAIRPDDGVIRDKRDSARTNIRDKMAALLAVAEDSLLQIEAALPVPTVEEPLPVVGTDLSAKFMEVITSLRHLQFAAANELPGLLEPDMEPVAKEVGGSLCIGGVRESYGKCIVRLSAIWCRLSSQAVASMPAGQESRQTPTEELLCHPESGGSPDALVDALKNIEGALEADIFAVFNGPTAAEATDAHRQAMGQLESRCDKLASQCVSVFTEPRGVEGLHEPDEQDAKITAMSAALDQINSFVDALEEIRDATPLSTSLYTAKSAGCSTADETQGLDASDPPLTDSSEANTKSSKKKRQRDKKNLKKKEKEKAKKAAEDAEKSRKDHEVENVEAAAEQVGVVKFLATLLAARETALDMANTAAVKLLNACGAALKARDFDQLARLERAFRARTRIDPSIRVAAPYSSWLEDVAKTLEDALRTAERACDDEIAKDGIAEAQIQLDTIHGLTPLRHAFQENRIDDIEQRLKVALEAKTDSFEDRVHSLLASKQFSKLADVLAGASGGHDPRYGAKLKSVTEACKQKHDQACTILDSAKITRRPLPQEKFSELAAVVRWFDKAHHLAAVLHDNVYTDWQEDIKNRCSDHAKAVKAKADNALTRWSFVTAFRQLDELSRFVEGFPASLREPAMLMHAEVSAKIRAAMTELPGSLTDALDKPDHHTIDEIVVGVKELVKAESEQTVFVDDVNVYMLQRDLEKQLEDGLGERSDSIRKDIHAYRIADATAGLAHLSSTLRSTHAHAALWQPRMKCESLMEEKSRKMKTMLSEEWLQEGDPSERSQLLQAYQDAEPSEYERNLKALTTKIHGEATKLKDALAVGINARAIHQADHRLSQLQQYTQVVPQPRAIEVELLDLLQFTERAIDRVVSTYSDAVRRKRWDGEDGVEKAKPCLEAAAKVLGRLAEDLGNTAYKEKAVAIEGKLTDIGDKVAGVNSDWHMYVADFNLEDTSLNVAGFISFLKTLSDTRGALEGQLGAGVVDENVSIEEAHRSLKRHCKIAEHERLDELWKTEKFEDIGVMLKNLKNLLSELFDGQTLVPTFQTSYEKIGSYVEAKTKEMETRALTCVRDALDRTRRRQRTPEQERALYRNLNVSLESLTKVESIILQWIKDTMVPSIRTPSTVVEEINQFVTRVADTLTSTLGHGTAPSVIVSSLLNMHNLPNELINEVVQQHTNSAMTKILDRCVVLAKKRPNCPALDFRQLVAELEAHGERGLQIVTSFPHFKVANMARFTEMMAKLSPEDALMAIADETKLDKDGSEVKALRKAHQAYLDEFTKQVQKHHYHGNGPAQLQTMAGEIATAYETAGRIAKTDTASELAKLVGGVFAVWSMQSAVEDADGHLVMNHPLDLQVFAIFRLLGVDTKRTWRQQLSGAWKNALTIDENHLIQVLTGQGKSITLGVLSVVLAVIGYDVDCVCYSEYLSKRDEADFRSTFDAFSVGPSIVYGTFDMLCERLVNKDADVRELSKLVLQSQSASAVAHRISSNRDRVLLFDEVDVFFDASFYGNTYNPSTNMYSEEALQLQKLAWRLRTKSDRVILSAIKGDGAYTTLKASFGAGASIVDAQLASMVKDLQVFHANPHVKPYKVNSKGKIAYKVKDTTSDEIVYGYLTLWAYFREIDAKNIEAAALKDMAGIQVRCGAFSYAQIPKQGYKAILGVTGTLEALDQPETKHIVENTYDIKKQTKMPSIFGDSKLDPTWEQTQVFQLPDTAQHHVKIQELILATSQKKPHAPPVLVFFETEAKMEAFAKSSYTVGSAVMITSAETDMKFHVKQATRKGAVYLFARDHGRGIDFTCKDPDVNAAGGVHVIQTFLSMERSEEVQIRGRTARQNKKGQYSLVTLASDFAEKLDISLIKLDEWTKAGKLYKELDRNRLKFSQEAARSQHEAAKLSLDKHKKTAEFQKQLEKATSPGARGTTVHAKMEAATRAVKFLQGQNKYVRQGNGGVKAVLALDGTCSMSAVLTKTKAAIGQMLQRLQTVLDEEGVTTGYELQIVVYRNYNANTAEELLQVSTWEASPERLEAFLDDAPAEYGWGNEAIELALAHANEEDADLVVIIGDAGPNDEDEVESKRRNSSAQWCQSPRFQTPTWWEPEVERLLEREATISVFSCRSDGKMPPGLQAIADEGEGTATVLDVNDRARGGEILIGAVVKEVLDRIGGADLIAAYEDRYDAQVAR